VNPVPQRPPLAADRPPLAADKPPPAMDPALDVVAQGPPVEDESFTLSKKRLELIIEEKEWELTGTGPGWELSGTGARKSEAKMMRIMEYVNAVEAYQELCAARVPHTAGPHCALIVYRCTYTHSPHPPQCRLTDSGPG